MLAAYRRCLLMIGEDDDADDDLIALARLGGKMKTCDFPLSHFLALVLPIERRYSKGLRDHEFLVTTQDAGKPLARRSYQVPLVHVRALVHMPSCAARSVRLVWAFVGKVLLR